MLVLCLIFESTKHFFFILNKYVLTLRNNYTKWLRSPWSPVYGISCDSQIMDRGVLYLFLCRRQFRSLSHRPRREHRLRCCLVVNLRINDLRMGVICDQIVFQMSGLVVACQKRTPIGVVIGLRRINLNDTKIPILTTTESEVGSLFMFCNSQIIRFRRIISVPNTGDSFGLCVTDRGGVS